MRGLKNLCGHIGVMVILLVTLFTGASALAYEIWVVNRLSSTISVVSTERDRVVRTIPKVGDKPDSLPFPPMAARQL
jgi:DNA-binding beta-propeller fold protein YncE